MFAILLVLGMGWHVVTNCDHNCQFVVRFACVARKGHPFPPSGGPLANRI